MKAKKIIYPKAGAIVEIGLLDGKKAYGRVLKDPLFAFYDVTSDSTLNAQEVLGCRIIFRIWVMRYAITSGRWLVIGHSEVEPDLIVQPSFFCQDPVTKRTTLFQDDLKGPIISTEQCSNLERAAVWDPEHVERRLEDHFAGRVNKSVEMLKVEV